MINKLKQKFVIVATASVAAMLLVVALGASIFNYIDLNQRTDRMIYIIAENGGALPKPNKKNNSPQHNDLPREAMFDTRYFVVYLGAQNEIVYTDTGNIYAANSEMAQEYAVSVLKTNKENGFIDNYKFLRTPIAGIDSVIFLDASRDIDMLKKFVCNYSMLSLVALVAVAVVSYLISPIAIKPIIESYEKQKKFITNASHEIKTPLTVIAANLDILEMNNGESKWIENSKQQIIRLTELVNSLVTLSRMEETENLERKHFDFSELCEMVSESYESMAISANKKFHADISPHIFYNGNEKALNQLCYILLDNAFKYSIENGTIFFSLSQRQERNFLTVTNEVDNIEIGKNSELFDRFYRGDESRNSETCGFGIGLSLAKSIVEKHNGKICAKSIDGKTLTIEVTL